MVLVKAEMMGERRKRTAKHQMKDKLIDNGVPGCHWLAAICGPVVATTNAEARHLFGAKLCLGVGMCAVCVFWE